MTQWKGLPWAIVVIVTTGTISGAALSLRRCGATPGRSRFKPVIARLIRSTAAVSDGSHTVNPQATSSAHFVGSTACEKCHEEIYQSWKKEPMANIVRDPRQFPDAIIPDLKTNNVSKFSHDQVAFVHGRFWKQRYFTKIGDDYFPLPVQWEISNHR